MNVRTLAEASSNSRRSRLLNLLRVAGPRSFVRQALRDSMNTHTSRLGKMASNSGLLFALLLLSLSCASRPDAENGDRHTGDRYTMAGYEFSTRSGDDTRPRILERFGTPQAEERAGWPPDYLILSYPISGQSERLLLLFHADELLGVFRDSARAMLDSTLNSHQRSQGGRVVLLQTQFGTEKPVYFTATREQLNRVPKWKPGDPTEPPLSEAQAEAVVSQWQEANAPQPARSAKVLRLQEVRSVPGVSFYQVAAGDFRSPPQQKHALVLMDGTLILGDFEP